jgi:CheY-like chemotaxis protein
MVTSLPMVVLIDNDEDDQEIFIMALKKLNKPITLKSFYSGQDALDYLRTSGSIPVWIFVDMNMPLMSGKECLIEIRKINSLAESDVYIYSTAAIPGMPDEVFNLGAKDFLLKPVEFKKLVNLLSGILFPVSDP